jgi:proteasome accessory factor B
MSKLERLLNLTAALLDTGRALTAAELKERIEGYPDERTSFHRAFERDKDDLREMGVPIEMITLERDDGRLVEAYRIPKDAYYLRDPGLAPDELGALHLAAAAVRMDGGDGLEALWKLGGDPGDAPAGAPVPAVHLPADPRLAQVFAAVSDRRVLQFAYQGETREIEPQRLEFRRGRWYITAYDRHRQAERNFRLDRVDGAVVAGPPEAFEPRAVGSSAGPAWELGDEAPVEAQLVVDADHAPWASHHLGDDARRDVRPDGAVVFTLTVTNRAAFRSFVLGFLEHAEILSPPELRDDMTAWLEACR